MTTQTGSLRPPTHTHLQFHWATLALLRAGTDPHLRVAKKRRVKIYVYKISEVLR